MFFNVESWRQVVADAGEAGGCLFCKKKKMALKTTKKKNIRHIKSIRNLQKGDVRYGKLKQEESP